jgi:hypothetical protein
MRDTAVAVLAVTLGVAVVALSVATAIALVQGRPLPPGEAVLDGSVLGAIVGALAVYLGRGAGRTLDEPDDGPH